MFLAFHLKHDCTVEHVVTGPWTLHCAEEDHNLTIVIYLLLIISITIIFLLLTIKIIMMMTPVKVAVDKKSRRRKVGCA